MKDMTSRVQPIDKLVAMSCELEKSVRDELIEGMREVEIRELQHEMNEFC